MEQDDSNRGEPIIVEELPRLDAHQVLDEMSEPKESSDSTAHHVLEEMPQSTNTIEVMQIDKSSEDVLKIDVALEQDLAVHHVLEGMTRIIDESVVIELEFESVHVNSVGESDDFRAFKVSDLKDATSLLLFKNVFTDFLSLLNEMPAQEEIRMNYREVLCFDPGGGSLYLVGDSFKMEIVPLESSNLGCDEELTKRNTEKVEFVPKIGDYGDCLPSFYPTNGQIFEVISVCAGMLNFDPGGRELRNLAEPFLHRFHFVRSSLLKFVVLKEISCLVLCSLDDTQLLVDANNESLIFDPGGEEFVFDYLNLLRLNTMQNVKDVCSNPMPFDPGGNGLTYSFEISINETRIQHTYKGPRAPTLSVANIYIQLDAVFDPRGSELISRDRAICLFNESDFAVVIPSPHLGVDINEARHRRIKITNQYLVNVAAILGVANMYAPRDTAGVDQGLSTTNLMCRLCFSGENEGSQREKKMLSCRSCSKKYHRRCLKTWAQHRDLFHWSSWICPSCRICEVCHQTGDPNKFKFCKRCDAAYHCHCMQPPHKNVSSGPYLCPNHTKCHSCESNVPGNGLSVRWFLGYTCCDACGRLFTKGNYCPVCLKVYRDSESTPMVCCDICQRWVHCGCDNISDEKYLQFQADDNLPYTCRTCRGECYQVKDLEDAVLELWRRRDEDDRDLIAALRAAVGLPTQEEIFSISSFSDDKDYGPPGVKNEYGRVNVSLEGLAESFSKKTQDSGKKASNKKKKKRYQMALDGKIGSNLIYEGHQDAVSMSYGLSPVQDVFFPLKRGHNALSSAKGICSISQQGDLKQKFVDEVGNNEKRHGILQIESKITNKVDAREDANKSLSKKTTKATKLVIHLGGRNRNTTNSPKSDTSSYQKEQELPVLNGREAGGQHREGEALSSERSDSAANHDEGGRFDYFHGMRGVTLRGREGTVIRLGKRKTEISLKGTPVLLTKRSKGTTKAAGDRTSLRKHPGSRSGVAGESHKTQSQEPSTSCATPKDSQSLLKLKFKTPFLGSWISHGEEEKGVVKGQRSKRKRPSQKPNSEEDEDAPESHQDSLMNEILDASWILKKLGKDAIGKRVEVQQQSDNSWHKGIVSNLVKGTSMLSVDLDDGRTKTVELGRQGIRFVPQKQKRQKL